MEIIKLPDKATLTTAVVEVKEHQYIVFYSKNGDEVLDQIEFLSRVHVQRSCWFAVNYCKKESESKNNYTPAHISFTRLIYSWFF